MINEAPNNSFHRRPSSPCVGVGSYYGALLRSCPSESAHNTQWKEKGNSEQEHEATYTGQWMEQINVTILSDSGLRII